MGLKTAFGITRPANGRKWVIWLRWSLLFIVLLVLARSVTLFYRLAELEEGLHPPRIPLVASDEQSARQLLGDIEQVQFVTKDGLTLRGWYRPSLNGAGVVMVHGKGNNRMALLPEAGELARQGMGVLLYDSRASGESDGKLYTWGDHERMDLSAAIDFLMTRPDVNVQRIGVHGFSVGAGTVALLAPVDRRIKAVVISGAAASLTEHFWHLSSRPKFLTYWWISKRYREAGVDLDAINPLQSAPSISPVPVLVIRGTDSTTVPVQKAQSVFDAAKEPKELLVVEGADHNDFAALGGSAYLSRVGSFFRRALLEEGANKPAS